MLTSSDDRAAIRVEGLSKQYELGRTTGQAYRTLRESLPGLRRRSDDPKNSFWALSDVSFSVAQGEILGIIGRNGAGKSTLLKLLSRVTAPTKGEVVLRGRVGSLLEVGTGFHPELSGRENVYLNGAILGMGRREIEDKLDEIVAFAGVERFLETPVKRYSSGMYLRLAFSVAAHLEPEILLVDEVLAVGDAEFQKKCIGRMSEVGAAGRTVLFVSHSMPAMLRLCPRLLLLDQGTVVADGPANEVVRQYMQSGLGSSAQREWPVESAPGDEFARLRAIGLVRKDGDSSDEVDVRDHVGFQVEFEQLAAPDGIRPHVFLTFRNEDGVYLFHTQDYVNSDWRETPRREGIVRLTCWLPPNFLAEGRHFVDVGASSHAPHREHFHVPDALGFNVVDHSSGDGVRGDWAGDWPGVVRPMLDWRVDAAP